MHYTRHKQSCQTYCTVSLYSAFTLNSNYSITQDLQTQSSTKKQVPSLPHSLSGITCDSHNSQGNATVCTELAALSSVIPTTCGDFVCGPCVPSSTAVGHMGSGRVLPTGITCRVVDPLKLTCITKAWAVSKSNNLHHVAEHKETLPYESLT
jgi:hypothetical protein